MDVLDEWDAAVKKMREALAHMVRHRGKPGHEPAKRDFETARDELDRVTRHALGEHED